MRRQRIKNISKDKRIFRKTASKTRVENLPTKYMTRGGIRL